MRIAKRTLVISLILFIFASLMSGCSVFVRNSNENQVRTKPITVTNPDELELGKYYVRTTDEDGNYIYQRTYLRDRNFEKEKYIPSVASSSKVAWYHEDFGVIPTLKKGDVIVFKTSQTIPTTFTFERYDYGGYTLGISLIGIDDNGRYYFDTANGRGISQLSDAYRLMKYNSNHTILDAVGSQDPVKLDVGNIARGGILTNPRSEQPGLEKDQYYKCVIYIGTMKHQLKIKADSVAFVSSDVATTKRSGFIEGDMMQVEIPTWFNSGYYRINNSGMFRYVAQETYNPEDDNINFNIPNVKPTNQQTQGNNIDENVYGTSSGNGKDTDTFTFSVPAKGEKTIKVSYTDGANKNASDPIVKLIGEEYAWTFEKDPNENSFTAKIELDVGDYTIDVSGLDGREVSYDID